MQIYLETPNGEKLAEALHDKVFTLGSASLIVDGVVGKGDAIFVFVLM